jgi:hypothetical protein
MYVLTTRRVERRGIMRLLKLTIAITSLLVVGFLGTATIFAVPACNCQTTANRKGVWNDGHTDCQIIECATDLELELELAADQ